MSSSGRSQVEKFWANTWQMYVDGASNSREAGVGIIMISLERIRVEKSFRVGFQASNNEAEYETLLMGLQTFKQIKVKWL